MARRRLAVPALAAVLALAPGVVAPTTGALFQDVAGLASDFGADVLDPPTGPAALGGSMVSLSWTPTVDSYADGYQILRSATAGGTYSTVATVSPGTAASGTDDPPPGTWWYRVRAIAGAWTSPATSAVSAGVTTSSGFRPCSSQMAGPGGDGNGYEGSPAQACGLDGLLATDTNSGSGTSTSCTATSKDKHVFRDFGLGVPASAAAITGIAVRATIGIDATTGTNRLCAQLSWNGGTSWTAAQVVPLTTTGLASLTLGGPAFTWARAWTGSQLSDATFRVRLIDVSSSTARDFRLDAVEVEVNYVP